MSKVMTYFSHRIIIADQLAQTRNLVSEVLRGGGFANIIYARDGQELLDSTVEYQPRIVITTSRLPGLSGLEYTRKIREGYVSVPRELSIIAMTDTPTKAFLEAAQSSGVDEMLVRPFTAQAIMLRIRAVLDHPREFVDSAKYIGPCRRRRMVDDYIGPMRRFIDPMDGAPGTPPWESEPSRKVVRLCVQKISEQVSALTPGDRTKLRSIYTAVKETEAKADEMLDVILASASRSLGRYIMAIGANGVLDPEVVTTHIDAMHTLGMLGSAQHSERENLVEGLHRIVDKRLGRKVA